MLTVDRQIEKVLHLRDEENKTFIEIAEELDISDRTARRRYQAGLLRNTANVLEEAGLEKFPELDPVIIKEASVGNFLSEHVEEIERFKPIIATGDAVLACDLHIPLHDPSLINTLIAVGKKNNIKQLLIPGDYFDMDEVSSYPPHQPEARLEIERAEGNLVMKTLLRQFDKIDITWGNHDYRLSRSTGFKYSFTECMKWMLQGLTDKEMSKITFSDLDYMYYYPSKDRKIRVCHPSSYSDVPLTVGRSLAEKYSCSVYTAHCHHFALGFAKNGVDLVLEGGGFFDPNRTEYIQRSTKNHVWNQGFFFFKNGIPHMISPLLGTDLEYRKEVNI